MKNDELLDLLLEWIDDNAEEYHLPIEERMYLDYDDLLSFIEYLKTLSKSNYIS